MQSLVLIFALLWPLTICAPANLKKSDFTPSNTRSLQIFYTYYRAGWTPDRFSWDFYGGPQGTFVDTCNTNFLDKYEAPEADVLVPPFPNGKWAIHNLFGEDCEYRSDGNSAGILVCPSIMVRCRPDPTKGLGRDGLQECHPKTPWGPGQSWFRHAVEYCEF